MACSCESPQQPPFFSACALEKACCQEAKDINSDLPLDDWKEVVEWGVHLHHAQLHGRIFFKAMRSAAPQWQFLPSCMGMGYFCGKEFCAAVREIQTRLSLSLCMHVVNTHILVNKFRGNRFNAWRETNARCARCYARCARFGARCFINPQFFHLVTAGCKHHSPTSISRACGRVTGSKICDHPPPSARAGTAGDRRP